VVDHEGDPADQSDGCREQDANAEQVADHLLHVLL
jgi:hypothetical protein